MKQAELSFPAIMKWLVAFAVAQWMAVPMDSRTVLQILVALMAVDYLTGLFSAFVTKTVSSEIGLRGLVKKGMVLCLLLASHLMEKLSGIELHLEFAGAIGCSVNEGISIVENCANAGVWVPGQVVDALIAIKKIKGGGATPEQLAQLRGDTMRDAYTGGASQAQLAQLRADQKAGTTSEK